MVKRKKPVKSFNYLMVPMALSSEQLEAETLSQIRSRQPSKGGPELVVEGHKKAVKVIKASASAQKTKKTSEIFVIFFFYYGGLTLCP